MRFVPSSGILRILRRTLITTAALGVAILGIGLLPGKMDGVYHPSSSFPTGGCLGMVEYHEFRGGRMNQHFKTDGGHEQPSSYFADYETLPDGSIEMRFRHGPKPYEGQVFGRAYPHLLFTHFVSTDGSSDGWRLKLPLTPSLKQWLADSRPVDRIWETAGIRKMTYDHDGNLLEESFMPNKPKS